MTERIELSENTISVTSFDEYQNEVICMGETGCPRLNKKQAKQLKHQILDDYDIVSNLGVNPRQLIKEWEVKLERCEKRAKDHTFCEHNISFLESLNKIFKQKLEKIEELLNRNYLYSNTPIFESNLKEILEEKQ